ncbi:sigma-70 family rna polymerase sigma factor : RNA polymerase, sigma-24 subunit, ECF subfamily OS=Planctomyces brasiliensis (strain ATCC 49424 / DSM 5305 / JCM 21570 / NBRC 103401 / IFAM 1448) GN=Plabr_0926 PE=4 SV=1: Sigma70_ECF [Gemmataceae bacterium]|nr:sigma-70 family rna polymerase sigma factor : RNA polymerase, sigma-24 subunit, ECF subfamily OS=Planctomyces brasiliensis (strain ATCC 49424 / DSM 5305 / JCM 21570 / NBRC 103401 / IFAM 1448) GN=Plabr_0926 PE=4 SV=1: Sigma70_ECF [Gemmataceae bacterium]VTU01227.1 sigma-70 family rna polymerase sigma factor : RNA polymerase, sigma-24 subunit, ECF subfamily OS=Planctomyces brasiliensis (strain ATCC 49424 / DSM 5305 / JCM 21570 / NBRC 103401 / IFAM 1448) GN=Plabr_0926 PE=4 SV=1: Sigma70_ECF [Gemmat
MSDGPTNTTAITDHLSRFRRGDAGALNDLIAQAGERLRALARRMLRDYPRVRRWSQTDDVLQSALMRLCRALEQVRPATPRDFYALATAQVRRELIDLARHHAGPESAAAHHESTGGRPAADAASDPHEPAALADWGEFHEQVAALPDEQREVFGLVFYQGLTQDAAADVLGVGLRTVQRRWQAALLGLHRLRKGEPLE